MLDVLKNYLERRDPRSNGQPPHPDIPIPEPASSNLNGECPGKAAKSIIAPKTNVWMGLTDRETASVTKWLFQQKELNLTRSDDSGDWDNTV
jgi:hypothetical protein